MSGKTISSAILVLVLGNLMATVCDVLVKLANAGDAVFQFTFYRVLFMCVVLAPLVLRKRVSRPLQGIGLHFVRGNLWVLTSVLLVISLSHLPLATANAVFYTAPIFIILLALIFYREKVSKTVVFAAISGFAGVLVILKPSYIGWGMLSALGFALVLAINSLLIRKLPSGQSAMHGLLVAQVCALPVAAILALYEGSILSLYQLLLAFGASICSVLYSLACLVGYRYVASSQVSSAEYSGLLFAIIAGWAMFGEAIDWSLLLGAALIVVPLIYVSRRDITVEKAKRLSQSATLDAT
ncbi:DMT family transporter [Marinomonas ostreistagni]|uniref:DMT family transporter n=1 Tax=Marinomonas ostreistagni TaxID=359209 RepID=A0ABS0Z8E5_9GAMM|nr:DMT family transporter [Marinomonas ostreistagni]MBJ7549928.1 DMT family transporter [Marinomonas ostreistagni]